jgi:hypothetical protein
MRFAWKKATAQYPGIFARETWKPSDPWTPIKGVIRFPIYDGENRIADQITISEDGKQGYSHTMGELKGDYLEIALELAKGLKRESGRRVIIVQDVILH